MIPQVRGIAQQSPAKETAPLAAHAPLYLERLSQDLLVLLGIDGRAMLVDVARAAPVRHFTLPDPGGVRRLSLTETGGHLLQEQLDGRFNVHVRTGADRLIDGYYVGDEVVAFDSALRFDATAEGATFVSARFPGQTAAYALDQLGARLHVPGLVAEVLAAGHGPDAEVAAASLLDALPPQLDASWSGGGSLAIRATAEAGLAGIDIFHDGALRQRITLSGAEAALELTPDPPPGTRWIPLRLRDAGGLTSPGLSLRVQADGAAPSGRLHVLAIGIDGFADPRLPDLSFARSDARAFAAAAAGAAERGGLYAETTVTVLAPEDGLQPLGARIAELAQSMAPQDTLMVFIATHGVLDERGGTGRLFLTDGASRAGTALGMDALSRQLGALPGRVFVFVDACHSGAADAARNEDILDSLTGAEAHVAVIAASKARQPSYESAALGGGAFTAALVRAFAAPQTDGNGNGALELAELYLAIKRDVVEATGGRQTPWIARSGYVGEVPLF
ncbi:caspase family protein [Pseudogemmobacter sonorensis]|uniref:caspase family protein n=1 Tax=Pseudogemmobacter sonorensis TaxID=2989681 RepID=UPI0036A4C268